jgi:hypothetical protein
MSQTMSKCLKILYRRIGENRETVLPKSALGLLRVKLAKTTS